MMLSKHTVLFDQPLETIFKAIQSLPPEYKWGEGMLYADTSMRSPDEVGTTNLILRNADVVIEEYTETLVELDAPYKLALSLTLDDFAMSRNIPKGHALPDAADLSRARARIADGRAINLLFALTLTQRAPQTEASLTIANAGQTAPKLGSGLFKRVLPNPAKTLLDWLVTEMDGPVPTSSSE